MSGDKRDHRGPVVDPAGGRAPGGPPRGIGGPRGGGGGAGDGGPRWRSAQAAGPAAWVMSGLGAGGRPLAKVPSFEDLMPAELRQNRASRAQQKNEAMARSAQAGPTGSSQAGGRAGAAQPGVSRQGMGAGLPHWQQSEQVIVGCVGDLAAT
ncbi:unnamed protein product [Ostreobium quekettii]|uniref:Uncharacterized protein n=1 Tax=Ostreobium quekettii TaxID=121088 RepID=A0A8S1IXC9_9CHLO|nr:unnamed protein product [Ostreobium quekettii]